MFANVSDRVTFESLKDYATNQFFRRDVFVKGKVQRDEAAAATFLDSTPFGTLIGEGALTREARLAHHTLHFTGAILTRSSRRSPRARPRWRRLGREPALAAFEPARLREAIVRLAIAGQVLPTMCATRSVETPTGRLRVAST